jgi:uncharacterized protein (TIGR02246 family)
LASQLVVVIALAAATWSRTEAQVSMADSEIQALVSDLAAAWNRGDAAGFAKSFRADGTFTNVNGTSVEGHSAFEQRHREVFSGPLKGSSTTMIVRRSQLLRPDVAIVDVDCATNVASAPSIQSKLLLVLVKEGRDWTIAAFHNTAVMAAPIVR